LTNEDFSLGINVGAVDMINERFVRQFRLGLLEVLRTTPKINMARVQIIKFGDYLKDLAPPLAVNTIRLNPLRGYSMVVIEPSIVFSSLDNFFGGFGNAMDSLPAGRLFTPTESSIIKIMMDVLFGSLQEAWAPILKIECEHVGSEINPQFAQIADENDLVVVSRFSSELSADTSGNIDIIYPYSALKPLRELLRSRVQTGDGDDSSDKVWSSELHAAALDSELDLKVKLTDIETTLKQFKQLREQDIIYINQAASARLFVNDVPVFDADVGSNGTHMAVKITKSLSPNK
jgi:flagellar motor switch protein FliM